MIKKQRIPILFGSLLLLMLLFPTTISAQEYFTIDQYDVTMNVQENHAYDIQENITVTFSEPRHGLYRYIPYSGSFYRNIDNLPTETPYRAKISNITVDGFNFKKTFEYEDMLLKIGDADTYVSGTQTYPIKYTWNAGDDTLDNLDDVYFNIIPTGWDTTINTANFKITMPKTFDSTQVEFISGKDGDTITDAVDFTVTENTITGKLNRPLANYQGVTLKINLPDGYFNDRNMTPDIPLWMYLIFGLSIIGSVTVWLFTGRDQKPIETVEFYPPNNFTPAQIGFIIDGDANNAEIISLITYWANNGNITIEQTDKKKFIFHYVKDLPGNAYAFEKRLFDKMFECGNRFLTESVPHNFYETIQYTKMELKGYFSDPDTKIFTNASKAGNVLINILASLPLFAYVTQGVISSHDVTTTGMQGIGIAIMISCMFIVIPTIKGINILTTAIRERQGKTKSSTIGKIVLGSVITLGMAIVVLYPKEIYGYETMMPAILTLLTVYATSFFKIIATKRTEIGNEWLGQTLGFKNFIEYAEKDRIEALVNKDPEYFFNILPYAYVLGVTSKWSKNFEDLALKQPDWYRSYQNNDYFSSSIFASELSRNMHQITSDIIVPPRSSGSFSSGGFSGGGGSSGGGGGGGGGGSW